MDKEKIGLLARAFAQLVIAVLGVLVIFGVNVPVISENALIETFTAIIYVSVLIWNHWKNNNYTPEAKEAQKRLEELKELRTDVTAEQAAAGVEIVDETNLPDGIGGAFTPRTTAPSNTNKYYLHVGRGGVNPCILIAGDSCLPNCVGYAYGRAYEVLGSNPGLSTGNAANWYKHADKWPRVKPADIQAGDVICWDDGGCGHVGFVETKNSDGSFTISQSAYGGSRFYLTKQTPPFHFGRFTCQGGIRIAPQAAYKITAKTGDVQLTEYRNCYSEPTSKSTRLTKIDAGAKLHYSQVCGHWYFIEAFNGWICLLDSKGNKFYKDIKLSEKKYKTLYVMNVRRYPTTSSLRVTSLAKGKKIKTRDVVGSWVYMIGNGWVCMKSGKEIYLEAAK